MDEIYQAPLLKRTLASFLDGVVTILLAIGLFMLLINGAVDIGFHNLGLKIQQYNLQEQSQLFQVSKDKDGNFLEISLLTYNEANKEEDKRFVNILHHYYFDIVKAESKNESEFNKKYLLFDVNSLQNAIYSIPSIEAAPSSYVLKDEVVDVATNKKVSKDQEKEYYAAISHFFMDSNKGVYNLAITDFTNGEAFQSVSSQLAVAERLEALICVAFSSFIFLCLPILINKHGETAFLHVVKICYTDSFGYQVRWRHKIIRAVTTLLLWSSSAYLFGVPLVVNAIVMFATGQKRSLIDYASNMIAIDRKTSVIVSE